MTHNQFVEMLIDHHVPFECWGRDAGEKVDRLYEDYLSKRRRLIPYLGGKLLVRTDYVALQICYRGTVLVETYSESVSGSHLCSSKWTMMAVMHDKAHMLDTMVDWIYRVLFEGKKLPNKFQFWLDRTGTVKGRPVVNPEYPGIWMISTVHGYRWELPDRFYERFGYAFGTMQAGSIYEWMNSPNPETIRPLLEIGTTNNAGQ